MKPEKDMPSPHINPVVRKLLIGATSKISNLKGVKFHVAFVCFWTIISFLMVPLGVLIISWENPDAKMVENPDYFLLFLSYFAFINLLAIMHYPYAFIAKKVSNRLNQILDKYTNIDSGS